MSDTQQQPRFGRLVERDDGLDFPFYDGRPVAISGGRWSLVVLACVLGFLVLMTVGSSDPWLEMVPRLLFLAIPVAAFAWASRGRWRALFRPLRLADLGTIVVFWLLNLGVSAVAAFVVSGGDPGGLAENTATDGLSGAGELLGFYLGTAIQLMGEEVFTILPFLAVMWWLHGRGASRRASILVAWLVTAVWFGAAHLPTYDWNVGQAIIVIGAARLVLTLAFIRTKNLWVSFGAHLLNDWTTFTIVLMSVQA
ncbi:CPBP family intramembrane glutamic endopeptidase [Nocardioides sp. GXQ0305]|uniref:CPBP family intramembrane glutamic endopeptidase n=1 Tax=Nocardioides sp. GXQ0305 TaxID=3423912 RepID=UPI003D7ED6A1